MSVSVRLGHVPDDDGKPPHQVERRGPRCRSRRDARSRRATGRRRRRPCRRRVRGPTSRPKPSSGRIARVDAAGAARSEEDAGRHRPRSHCFGNARRRAARHAALRSRPCRRRGGAARSCGSGVRPARRRWRARRVPARRHPTAPAHQAGRVSRCVRSVLVRPTRGRASRSPRRPGPCRISTSARVPSGPADSGSSASRSAQRPTPDRAAPTPPTRRRTIAMPIQPAMPRRRVALSVGDGRLDRHAGTRRMLGGHGSRGRHAVVDLGDEPVESPRCRAGAGSARRRRPWPLPRVRRSMPGTPGRRRARTHARWRPAACRRPLARRCPGRARGSGG